MASQDLMHLGVAFSRDQVPAQPAFAAPTLLARPSARGSGWVIGADIQTVCLPCVAPLTTCCWWETRWCACMSGFYRFTSHAPVPLCPCAPALERTIATRSSARGCALAQALVTLSMVRAGQEDLRAGQGARGRGSSLASPRGLSCASSLQLSTFFLCQLFALEPYVVEFL